MRSAGVSPRPSATCRSSSGPTILNVRLGARRASSSTPQGYNAPERAMTRSLGNQLPDSVRRLLDGSNLASREVLTFMLLTTDDAGWPHMALLSVGELVAMDERTLRAGLWLHSSTRKTLTQAGRAMLTLIADGNGYYVRLAAQRGPDLDLGAEGRLAYFVMQVEEVQEESVHQRQV